MTDTLKAGVIISQSQTDSNRIRDIVHGTTTFAIPSVAANGAVGSASGIAAGVTSDMNVIIQPFALAANQQVILGAADAIADGIQVTATNPSASAIAAFTASASYFAWR